METYTFLREFADSWFLIVLFGFFIGVWIFAFWPSLQPARDDAASIPMRDDKALEIATTVKPAFPDTSLMKGPQNG